MNNGVSSNTGMQQALYLRHSELPLTQPSFQLQTPPTIVNIFIITCLHPQQAASQLRKPKISGEVRQALILREGGVWEYGAVSLPILGLDVSTFYGRCYLCADHVCVMDNVCRGALSGLNVSTFYERHYLNR